MSATKTGGAAASTAAGTQVYTGFGSSAATNTASGSSSGSSGSNGAPMLLNLGQLYGLGVIATGLLTAFTILL